MQFLWALKEHFMPTPPVERIESITCLIRLVESMGKASESGARIEWAPFYSSIEDVLRSDAPDLSTPHARAVELRSRVDHWTIEQSRSITGLLEGWQYKRIPRDEMEAWEKRIENARSANETTTGIDSAATALEYFHVAPAATQTPPPVATSNSPT